MANKLEQIGRLTENIVTLLPIFWATNIRFPERKKADLSVSVLAYEPKLVQTREGEYWTKPYKYDAEKKCLLSPQMQAYSFMVVEYIG